MTDVASEINASQRRVGRRTLQAGEARVVSLVRTYDATTEDLWDAVTNPARIPRWFLPVSGELRPGGHYQLEGNAGGTIERCDPPRGFSITWEFGGSLSWVEVQLAALADGGTRLELAHVVLVADDDKWDQFGPGAVGVGWDLALRGLGRHLQSGRQLDPAAAQAWSVSDEGRMPYHRPPLSKELLRGETSEQELPLEEEFWLWREGVSLICGRAMLVDRARQEAVLAGGRRLG